MTKQKLATLLLSCMMTATLATTGNLVKAADSTQVDVITSASTTTENETTDSNSTNTSAKELSDGSYTANFKILKETEDAASMAGNHFTSTGAKLTVKNGSYTLRVEFTNPMIENLRQVVNGKETALTVKQDGDKKYVELKFSSINDAAYFAMDINTGTSYGVMSHVVRVLIDADSVKAIKNIAVTKVTLNKKTANAIVGDKLTLTTTVSPANATNSSIVWTTSDKSIATVSQKGVVTMKGAGTVTITATAADGSGKKATCKISVKYGITYVLNGGTNNAKNPSTYANGKVTLKSPTKKGYTFAGWFTNKACTKSISSISATSKKNITVYAKWTKVSVKTTNLTSVTSKKAKNMTATFSSVPGAKGFQIVYSTSSKFTKSKSITTTSTSKTVNGLTSRKTYYVKVRAYKTDSTGYASNNTRLFITRFFFYTTSKTRR